MSKRRRTAIAKKAHGGRNVGFVVAFSVLVLFLIVGTVLLYYRFDERGKSFAHSTSAGTISTNNQVYAAKTLGSTTYIGGTFSVVGTYVGNYATIDATTGIASSTLPKFTGGAVEDVEPDGSGGWYVGGSFSTIDGVTTIQRLVHVLSNGSIDQNFKPNPNSSVYGLELIGNNLYVGGAFTTIASTSRPYLAVINATTGAIGTAFTAQPGNQVRDIDTDATHIYAVGQFTTPGTRVIRYDLATQTHDAGWVPVALNNTIFAVDASGTDVYIGGDFTNVAPNYARALTKDTAATTAFAPTGINGVRDIIVNGSTTYLAYNNGLRAFDSTNGSTLAWNPAANGAVADIDLSGTTLYAAGSFTTIGGQNRRYIAALDTTVDSNNATGWDPSAGDTGAAIKRVGSNVLAGGALLHMGAVARNGIAAIDNATGTVLPWNPSVQGGAVYAIDGNGTALYIGGTFSSIGGSTRLYLGAIDLATGAVLPWDPSQNGTYLPTGQVNTVALDATTLYVGGTFTTIANTARNRAAAFDVTVANGAPIAWDPNVTGTTVVSVVVGPSEVYLGGTFTTVGASTRASLAKVDKSAGTVAAWNPAASGALTVRKLQLVGTTLYAAHVGTLTIGGQSRTGMVALDTTVDTNMATAWAPTFSPAGIDGFTIKGTAMFVAGSFSNISGVTGRNRLGVISTAINSGASQVGSWTPFMTGNTSTVALAADDNRLYVGGNFTRAGTENVPYLAAFPLSNVSISTPTVSASESVGSTPLDVGITTTLGVSLQTNLTVTGGTATPGVDASVPASLTIDSGQPTGSASVTVTDDFVDEPDETIEVTISVPSPDAIVGSSGTYTLTITDNDTAGFTVNPVGPVTSAEGTSISYTIALTSEPTADVTVDFASDLGQVTLPASGLTFNAGNWSTPQLVSIDINDNSVDDGDRSVDVTHQITSGDAVYAALSLAAVTINVSDNDTAGFTVTESDGSTQMTESATDTIEYVLTSQPLENVTLTLTPVADLTVDPAQLTFTPASWDQPQTVTVSAVENDRAEGARQADITYASESLDPLYDGYALTANATTVLDNDEVGVDHIEPGPPTAITEGDSTTIPYVLTSEPFEPVEVTLADGVDLTLQTTTLNFDSTNWSTPQDVVVSANENAVADGDRQQEITHQVMSADTSYDGLAVPTVTVAVQDNDSPGITVTQSDDSTTIVEGGSDAITYVLTSQPTSNVSISFTANDRISLSSASLAFTTTNWSTPQTVTLSVADNTDDQPDETTELQHQVASSDLSYNGFTVAPITVTITDNDLAGVIERVTGADPVELAAQISQLRFADTGSAEEALIARSDQAIDTFTAGPLARLVKGPILLTATETLDQRTLTELQRVLSSNAKRITIVGGLQAISQQTEDQLRALGNPVERLAGANRDETAERIADAIMERSPQASSEIFFTENNELVDALSAGSPAGLSAQTIIPILIQNRGQAGLGANVSSFINRHTEITKVTIVGGTTAMPSALEGELASLRSGLQVARSGGANRYQTNVQLVRERFAPPQTVIVARGDRAALPGAGELGASSAGGALYAALLSGPLGAELQAPVLIVPGNGTVPDETIAYLDEHTQTIIRSIVIIAADEVSDSVIQQLEQHLLP